MSKPKPVARKVQLRQYPAPKSDRCQQLMVAIINALGKLPSNDDGIEDRVLACVLVAWGELAAMRDPKRRDEVVASLGSMGQRVVAKTVAAADEFSANAKAEGRSVAETLFDAIDAGDAEELPLPPTPRSSR